MPPNRAPASIVFGAGGHGRELRFQLEGAGSKVAAFVDELDEDRSVDELRVLRPERAREEYPDAHWHVAMGNIGARIRIVESLISQNVTLGSFISPAALVAPRARIDEPAQVFANVVVSEGAHLEGFCVVNFGCVISHDVRIRRFAYLSPGVCVAGHVHIGERAWLGVGVTVRNGSVERPLKLGAGVVVGAGACVIRDIAPGTTAAGVPAKALVSRGKV